MEPIRQRTRPRRAATLLGFSSASGEKSGGAVAALTDIILNAEGHQVIHLHGLRNGVQLGIQVSCEAPWLASASHDNALIALRSKLGDMMDEVDLESGSPPRIKMVMWLSGARATQVTGSV